MTIQTSALPLPAILEHTAAQVFASFSERLRSTLNGRQDRALKLALEGHVTHKSERVYSVRSEQGDHTYLVDLAKSFCTCPDSQKGHVCKHRLAAYLVEQANQAVPAQTTVLTPAEPLKEMSVEPSDDAIERARLILQARSEYMRESIVYAMLQVGNETLPVELISLEGDIALVRALPYEVHGKPVPRFPFPERKSFTQVIAKSLTDVKIYR